MIEKEVLLGALTRCAEEEIRALSFFSRHDADPSFLAGFFPNERDRIMETLKALKQESASCAETYMGLIKSVGEADQDAF